MILILKIIKQCLLTVSFFVCKNLSKTILLFFIIVKKRKMDKDIVLKAIAFVEHPSINATLKDLGILSKIDVEEKTVVAEFSFPFANIPIKDALIGPVQILAASFGFQFKHTERVMTEEEKKRFLEIEHANWKSGNACSC